MLVAVCTKTRRCGGGACSDGTRTRRQIICPKVCCKSASLLSATHTSARPSFWREGNQRALDLTVTRLLPRCVRVPVYPPYRQSTHIVDGVALYNIHLNSLEPCERKRGHTCLRENRLDFSWRSCGFSARVSATNASVDTRVCETSPQMRGVPAVSPLGFPQNLSLKLIDRERTSAANAKRQSDQHRAHAHTPQLSNAALRLLLLRRLQPRRADLTRQASLRGSSTLAFVRSICSGGRRR